MLLVRMLISDKKSNPMVSVLWVVLVCHHCHGECDELMQPGQHAGGAENLHAPFVYAHIPALSLWNLEIGI